MCGIFGLIQTAQSRTNHNLAKELLHDLCLFSETRGKDASGIVGISPVAIRTLKRSIRVKELLLTKEFKKLVVESESELNGKDPSVFLGHTRMITNGDANLHNNNQPCIGEHFVCLHNGIIVNEHDIRLNENLAENTVNVDTQVIIELMEKHYSVDSRCSLALQQVLNQIKGANSIALICNDLNSLYLYSANGSLFVYNDENLLLFASEKFIIKKTLKSNKINFQDNSIIQIAPQTTCCISFSESVVITHINSVEELSNFKDVPAKRQRIIFNFPASDITTNNTVRYTGSYTALEKLCNFDTSPIDAMRRCSKCLLPESFPYIKFDTDGICNVCHNYDPWQHKGDAELEKILSLVRSNSNAADCLLPVSGGRDSSYLLHYVCKELNMKPIAYTYDWGMVTDLARRNISRMCGELGIEHILISANIKQKRINIRKNVLAWLKKPHLGAVTLFMAGDKPYFYYAYILRRQMNLKYTLLGANRLERTDFKVGFCNIDQDFNKAKFYSLNIMNKLKLLKFFGNQFISNPEYLNTSLLDTALGFASYYLLPSDYVSTYDYIEWNENIINDTLINGYNWETATDTKSTWRIGDGTAAFYNYIYYKMAGFSENDTFRSNQIRQGIISRDDALKLTQYDNIPRVESIKWYCDTIGIDAYETIKIINSAKVLYSK